jgi:hypothetical protein
MPLELLKNEVSYGVNAVHLLYGKTSWRPNHLVVGDITSDHRDWVYEKAKPDHRIDRFLDIIDANGGSQIHIRGNYRVWAKPLLGPRNNVSYFDVCTHHSMGVGDDMEEKAPTEWHLPQICRWGGAVLMAVQLAALGGHSPLYMIGCDLGYEPGTRNHFTSGYDESISAEKAEALNKVIRNAHALAYVSWDIYNAGAGGTLETYPRVIFGELFQ